MVVKLPGLFPSSSDPLLANVPMGHNETIAIEWPPVGVDQLERILRGFRLGIAPLWAAGRLPPLLNDPEMREAIRVHEALLFSAVEQWSRARRQGRRTLALRLALPAAVARPWVSLAHQLCDLMPKADAMLPLGLEPVAERDVAFARTMLAHAEDAVRRSDPGD